MSLDPQFVAVRDKIMVCGSTTTLTQPDDVYNALVICKLAKDGGHAVVMDETFDSKEVFVEAHVIHYLTCAKCQKEKLNVH